MIISHGFESKVLVSVTDPIGLMDNSQIAEEGLNLNGWEQIQSSSHNILSTNPTREWDMIAIRDNYLQDSLSFFPPSQHEGLPVRSEDEKPNSPSPSSSSSSSSSSSNVLAADNSSSSDCWPRLKILGSGIVRIAAKAKYLAVFMGGFWSFASATGVVAAVLLFLVYAKVRRWRSIVREENNRLILLINGKDQKINQLLLQNSQMSELLSARRKVPVLRTG